MVLSSSHQSFSLKFLKTLNESQSRWYVAKEALSLGRGGLKAMNELTGMSRPTIMKGMNELRSRRFLDSGRIRNPGGGRKRKDVADPKLKTLLERMMEETTAGDPMSALRWTSKSTYSIADELSRQGCEVSQRTIHRRLVDMDYSLQSNIKTKEGTAPANRDRQFKSINALVKKFLSCGSPVLSIDAKKKENVGNFKNNGRNWLPKGEAKQVNVYDYPSLAKGKATPYGAYDVHRNEGFVNVGMTHDTAEFAVESLRQWWSVLGRHHYQGARKLLLCADGGGSNGSRNRSRKYFVQQWADERSMEISICHYPPGTSKWNKIEHRMFSFISINWRGEPLVSYETIVNMIGATKTRKGLRIKSRLDKNNYEKGKKISEDEMDELNIKYHDVNPQWNYTISPRTKTKAKK